MLFKNYVIIKKLVLKATFYSVYAYAALVINKNHCGLIRFFINGLCNYKAGQTTSNLLLTLILLLV